MNSVLRKPSFLLVMLLGLLPLSFLLKESRDKSSLDRYEGELIDKGEELSIADLIPPHPPSDQNGATPFLAAVKCLSNSPVLPVPRSFTWFVAPGKSRVRWMEPQSGAEQSTNTWPALGRQIEAVRVNLIEIEKALQKPCFDFGVKYRPLHYNDAMPHLTAVKRAAAWLEGAALWQLRETNRTEALNRIQSIVALSGALKDEPLELSQLVRLSIARIGLLATWEALQLPGWTEAQLYGIQSVWQTNRYAEGMLRSLEMERAIYAKTLDLLQNGDRVVVQEFFGSSRQEAQTDEMDRYMGVYVIAPLWRKVWGEQARLHFLQHSQEMIEAGRRVVRAKSLSDWNAGCNEFGKWSSSLDFYKMVRFWPTTALSGVARDGLKMIHFETEKEMTITAIALKRYALRHGRYPTELEVLVPEFLSQQQTDYMAGKPFGYKLRPDGTFTLYSVGDDQHDDGGDPSLPPGQDEYYGFWTGRDAVWPTPATPMEIQEHTKLPLKSRRAHRPSAPPPS